MKSIDNFSSSAAPPRVWVLASPHSGDNTQLNALAEALGWPFEIKTLRYRGFEELLRLTGLATLRGVDLGVSSPIVPPWPDLILSAGRPTEAVGFWIRRYGNPAARFVFVGTPWAPPSRFDLVITTPQYALPQQPNILHNMLPMHGVTPARIASEAERWRSRLSHLPEPRVAVLVGGSSGPYLFRPEAAARLGREASQLAASMNGSLLVTTSARTPAACVEALAAAIDVPHVLYRWQKGSVDNPFHAFLGFSDRIIVTADSVSMLAEAVATGKPVSLFDIEEGPQSMRAEEAGAPLTGPVPPIYWRGRDLATTAFRLLMNHAPVRWSRDLRIVHRQLVAAGLAAWLGEPIRANPKPPEPALDRAVTRIAALFRL